MPNPNSDSGSSEKALAAGLGDLMSGAERRRAPREALTLPVELAFRSGSLDGSSADVSETGLLFLTDAPIEVIVRIQTESGHEERIGRLVRAQQLGATISALAIQFDEQRRL